MTEAILVLIFGLIPCIIGLHIIRKSIWEILEALEKLDAGVY